MDLQNIATRVKLGISRKQVAFAKDNVRNLARRGELGLVWILEDLSRNTCGKLILECEKYKVPVIVSGTLEEVSAITGEPAVLVYLLKRNFSGLNSVLHDLRASGELDA